MSTSSGTAIALLVVLTAGCANNVPIPAEIPTSPTPTACELLDFPERFDRTVVSVRGRIQTGFQDSFLVDLECGGVDGRIWLEWADDLPAEAWGEFARVSSGQDWYDFLSGKRTDYGWQLWKPRPAIELRRDASFRELNAYLSQRSPHILLRPGRAFYEVEATITGRFDHLPGTIILRNASGHRGMQVGFGPGNRWMDRIVVRGVAEVQATRVAE